MDRIERAARILYEKFYPDGGWNVETAKFQIDWVNAFKAAIEEYEREDEPVVYRAVWFEDCCCTSFASLNWFIGDADWRFDGHPTDGLKKWRPDTFIKGNVDLPATLDAAGLKWRMREGTTDELEVIDEPD